MNVEQWTKIQARAYQLRKQYEDASNELTRATNALMEQGIDVGALPRKRDVEPTHGSGEESR